MDFQQEAEALRKVPMFEKLEPSRLKLLAFTSESLSFDDGEVLFREGESADCAYVIIEGNADIIAETQAGEVVVGTLGKNQLVGELAVLTNSPRSATIVAKGHLVALRITDEMFIQLLGENPEMALDALRQVSAKLVLAHQQFEELQTKLRRLESAASGT